MLTECLLAKLAQQKKHCTGCGACENICPVHAITMQPDAWGFLYPHVDAAACIHCSRCEHICPKLAPASPHPPAPACYAVRADDAMRAHSSSGGVFGVLAREILRSGGLVAGAAMADDGTVSHIAIKDAADLHLLQQSKYVQSKTGHIYQRILKWQMSSGGGHRILFSGCPCQVAAARKFFHHLDNIYFVEVLCHGVPSEKMWLDYLEENFSSQDLDHVEFRSKRNGWRSDQLRAFYRDGTEEAIPWHDSAYEEGFQRNISLRTGCNDCEFCGRNRQGDITLGDFWRIEEYRTNLNDRKGTSLVSLNSARGKQLFQSVEKEFIDVTEVPWEAARFNRLHEKYPAHPARSRFFTLYPETHDFSTAIRQCRYALYDIGLIGTYTVPNYGGELTQYMLYRTLRHMGYSVLMIDAPSDVKGGISPSGPPLFSVNPYPDWDRSRYYPNIDEMRFLNLQCTAFISGSDQMFNHNMWSWFHHFMGQPFVTDNHRKIAYAASWGHDHLMGDEQARGEEGYFLSRFDFFSVREASAVELVKRAYGRDAAHVLDPVFLGNRSDYDALLARATFRRPDADYLFFYCLDAPERYDGILTDFTRQRSLHLLHLGDAETVAPGSDASIEDWLSMIAQSSFVVTDSFHGMCLCLIFHKQFLVHLNKKRGAARFTSILRSLGLMEHAFRTSSELSSKLSSYPVIPYEGIDLALHARIEESKEWLRAAIESPLPPKSMSAFDLVDRRCHHLCIRIDTKTDALQKEINSLTQRIQALENRHHPS